MELGVFSISLTVKDVAASMAFYEKPGFTQFGGEVSQNWVIMKNGETLIGLFEGMFDTNMLTFNPGWDSSANEVDPFADVRELHRQLAADGIEFVSEPDDSASGPASFIVLDPDGNPILVDQHR